LAYVIDLHFIVGRALAWRREDTYAVSVDAYFEQLGQLGRVDLPRFKIIVHDLRTLLRRYAHDESFSADSLGGGRASNANLVPYMVQMGLFLLDKRGAAQRSGYTRTFRAFVEEPEGDWDRSNDLVCPGGASLPIPGRRVMMLCRASTGCDVQ
jgi:hypothetical protein